MPGSKASKPAGNVFVISPGEIIAVASVLPALCIIFVTLRFHVRRSSRVELLMDDWFTLPALVKSLDYLD